MKRTCSLLQVACPGDGSKLPPYVAFKQKTLPKNMNFPEEVLIRCQGKGMDQELVQDWLRTVWGKVGGLTRRSLCWCGILFEPTCHHRSVTHWSRWIQSPLLQVCCIPWMLQSTSLLKIVWGRSGRSGCWLAKTPSLPAAIFPKVELDQICWWIPKLGRTS